jgi:hypothetical protein
MRNSLRRNPERLIDPRDQRLRALQVSGGRRVAEQAHRLMNLLAFSANTVATTARVPDEDDS